MLLYVGSLLYSWYYTNEQERLAIDGHASIGVIIIDPLIFLTYFEFAIVSAGILAAIGVVSIVYQKRLQSAWIPLLSASTWIVIVFAVSYSSSYTLVLETKQFFRLF